MRLFHLLVFITMTPVAAHAAEPKEVVAAVIKLDKGGWKPIFGTKPTPLMKRYFTAAFNASWTKAMMHNKDDPVLDSDPITNIQSGMTGISIKSLSLASTGSGSAIVRADIIMMVEGKKAPGTITFALKQNTQGWKIDDIVPPDSGSLRAYFHKSFGA